MSHVSASNSQTSALRQRIHEHLRCDEDELLQALVELARFSSAERSAITARATPLIEQVRAGRNRAGGIDAFMNTYELSSREGVVLMCRIDAGSGEVPAVGCYFAPRAYEIDALSRLSGEVFGSILHVIRWPAEQLDAVCAAIAAIATTGYGPTLGIHSRIDATVRRIIDRLQVGNIYVNRNQIGAVVGVQPFGGHGLSGTGPKAGGGHPLSLRLRADRFSRHHGGGRQRLLAGRRRVAAGYNSCL